MLLRDHGVTLRPTRQHALLLGGDTAAVPALTSSVEGHVYSLQLAAGGVGLGEGDGLQTTHQQHRFVSIRLSSDICVVHAMLAESAAAAAAAKGYAAVEVAIGQPAFILAYFVSAVHVVPHAPASVIHLLQSALPNVHCQQGCCL
jgi:hypothetical protein